MYFPEKINRYTKALIERSGRSISCQVEVEKEAETACEGESDPTFEEKYRISQNIIHKFKGRLLVIFTDQCFCNCRFCFRKNRSYFSTQTPAEIVSDLQSLLSRLPDIDEIIISGGDFFTLEPADILHVLEALSVFGKIIRFHSRVLTFDPEKLSDAMIRGLANIPSKWFVSHFNHPDEITSETVRKIRDLAESPVPLLNQTVLLKGLNDDPEILRELFLSLYRLGVKPYYLHQLDETPGNGKYKVDITRGIEIMKTLLAELPGAAVPRYVRDGDCNAHKTILV